MLYLSTIGQRICAFIVHTSQITRFSAVQSAESSANFASFMFKYRQLLLAEGEFPSSHCTVEISCLFSSVPLFEHQLYVCSASQYSPSLAADVHILIGSPTSSAPFYSNKYCKCNFNDAKILCMWCACLILLSSQAIFGCNYQPLRYSC